MKRRVIIEGTKPCGEVFGVTSLRSTGGSTHAHRKTPCEECPWRMDVPTGVFPAEAFRTSAPTAYDAAQSMFACHMAGLAAATCAGFLLRHDENNLAVRLSRAFGKLPPGDVVSDGGFPVYPSYRDMAIANGVGADEEVLRPIRANGEQAEVRR